MAKGKKRPAELPEYGTVMMKGVQYYRTRITDADGKRVAIYGLTREESYGRVEDAQKKIAEGKREMTEDDEREADALCKWHLERWKEELE